MDTPPCILCPSLVCGCGLMGTLNWLVIVLPASALTHPSVHPSFEWVDKGGQNGCRASKLFAVAAEARWLLQVPPTHQPPTPPAPTPIGRRQGG